MNGENEEFPRQSDRVVASEVSVTEEPRQAPLASAVGQRDAIELALADAITKATAANEWGVVGQLAKELEERRLDARLDRLGEVAVIGDVRRER